MVCEQSGNNLFLSSSCLLGLALGGDRDLLFGHLLERNPEPHRPAWHQMVVNWAHFLTDSEARTATSSFWKGREHYYTQRLFALMYRSECDVVIVVTQQSLKEALNEGY
jgi:hypothetical protein